MASVKVSFSSRADTHQSPAVTREAGLQEGKAQEVSFLALGASADANETHTSGAQENCQQGPKHCINTLSSVSGGFTALQEGNQHVCLFVFFTT